MGDTDTLHGTLPSSMTVEPEPTREHLAERLSVLERELAQAKRTILTLECERDESPVKCVEGLAFETTKPRPDLIPAEALLEAGACMAGGLERDDPNGQPWYETAPRADALRKYRRSMLRHVLAWYAGDKVDGDSGKSPLAHIICNAAILFWVERRK